MPRSSTYWKNPEKYRQQAKDYSARYYQHKKNRKYVPRNNESLQTTFGELYNNTAKKHKGLSRTLMERSLIDLDSLRKFQEMALKHTSKKNLSRKIKHDEKVGQVIKVDGTSFMTTSEYSRFLQRFGRKLRANYSTAAGMYGMTNFVKYIEQRFRITDGFMIYVNTAEQHGVDCLINKYATPYIVFEITNYQQTSFLAEKDIDRYIKNLNGWSDRYPDIFKVIVVAYPDNLKDNPYRQNAYEDFVKNNIGIKILR